MRSLFKIRPLTIVAAFIILTAAVLIVSFVRIDVTSQIPRIKAQAESRINGSVDMKNISLKLLPSPNIIIKEFRLSVPAETIASASTVKAGVELWPLLSGDIRIKNVTLDKAKIIVRRSPDGTFNLQRLTGKTQGGKKSGAVLLSLALDDASVEFIDESVEEKPSYVVSGVKAHVNRTASGFSYNLTGIVLPETPIVVSGTATAVSNALAASGVVSIKELKVRALRPYIKASLKDNDVSGNLSAEFSYDVSGGKGALSGKTSLSGAAITMPAVFSHPIKGWAAAAVKLSWDGGSTRAALSNIDVEADGIKARGSLNISLPEKTIAAEFSAGRINAAHLKDLPSPSLLGEGAKKFAADFSNISGTIELKRLAFSTADAKTSAGFVKNVMAEMELDGIGFRHARLIRPIGGFSGHASLKGGRLTVTNAAGKYGKSAIEKLGLSVEDVSAPSRVKLTLAASVDAAETVEEAARLLSIAELKDVHSGGKARLSLSVDGVPENKTSDLKASFSLDLTGASFAYKRFAKKDTGHLLVIESSLALNPGAANIESGAIRFGASSITMKGKASRIDGSYDISFFSSAVRMEDIPVVSSYFFSKDSPSRGTIYINVAKKKGASKASFPAYGGEFGIKNGLFKSPFFAKPVRNMSATMRLSGNSAEIILEDMRVGDSPISGKITVTDVEKHIIDFELFSPRVNVSDFYESGMKLPEDDDTPTTGRGRVSVKSAFAEGITLKNISADVSMGRESANISNISGASDDGRITGNVIYHRGSKSRMLFDSYLTVARMNAASLLDELGDKKKTLSGDLSAEINLKCRNVMPFTAGLDGTIKITSSSGTLKKLGFLNKVLAILNIFNLTDIFKEGLPYKTITGDYNVKNGVITTSNMALKSNSLDMSASGYIDLTKEIMNSQLGIHSRILILPLPSVYFDIKGPLKDLNVTPSNIGVTDGN